jgi:hypothetical protein
LMSDFYQYWDVSQHYEYYACRKISPSFVDRYKYTRFGQPVVRGGRGSDSA